MKCQFCRYRNQDICLIDNRHVEYNHAYQDKDEECTINKKSPISKIYTDSRCMKCKKAGCILLYKMITVNFKHNQCKISKQVISKNEAEKIFGPLYKLNNTEFDYFMYHDNKKSFSVLIKRSIVSNNIVYTLEKAFNNWLKHIVIAGRFNNGSDIDNNNLLEVECGNSSRANNYIKLLQRVTNYKVLFYKELYNIKDEKNICMRDATKEEQQVIQKHIDEISEPTGEDFFKNNDKPFILNQYKAEEFLSKDNTNAKKAIRRYKEYTWCKKCNFGNYCNDKEEFLNSSLISCEHYC